MCNWLFTNIQSLSKIPKSKFKAKFSSVVFVQEYTFVFSKHCNSEISSSYISTFMM